MAKQYLTGESVKSAIALRINSFYPSIPVSTEKIIEDFELNHFHINQIDVSQSTVGLNTYSRDYSMEIFYFIPTDSSDANEQLDQMGEDLFCILDKIYMPVFNKNMDITAPVNGKNMEHKIEKDNCYIQFYVTYSIRAMRDSSEIAVLMENMFLTIRTRIFELYGVMIKGNPMIAIVTESGISINGVRVPQEQIINGVLTKTNSLWDGLKEGDTVMVFETEDNRYYITEQINEDRTSHKIDGGTF